MEHLEILNQYRDLFLGKIEHMCSFYKVIGKGTVESPMWFQFSHFNCFGNDGTRLTFKSSQCGLEFDVDLNEDHIGEIDSMEFTDIYNYFRTLKYTYIKENHPTIWKQLR